MRKGLLQIQNQYQFLDEEYNTNEFSKLFQKYENDLTLNENANIFYMITDSMWVINDLKLNINFDSLDYIISYYTLYIKPLNTIKNQEKLNILVLLLELCITLDIQKSKELCLLFYEDISNRNCEFNLCLNDIYKEIRKKFKFKDYAFVKDTLSELTHVFKNRVYIYRTSLFNWLMLMKYSDFKSNKTFYFHLENIGRIYNDFRFTKSDIKDLEKWNVTPEQLKQTIHKMITEDVDLCKILNQKRAVFNCSSCNVYDNIHHIKKNPYLFILITSLKYNLDLNSLSQYSFNEKTGFIKNDSFFKYFCDNEIEIKENLLNYDLQAEADRVIKEFFKNVNIKDIHYFNSHVSTLGLRVEKGTRKLTQFYASNSYGAPLIYISTIEIEGSQIRISDIYFNKDNEPTTDCLEKNGTKEELMYINNQFFFKRSSKKNKYSNYRPLNLKDIKDNKILLEFVKIYLNYLYNNKIYFAKDILTALEQNPMYLPVPLSELLIYKNWAHFFNEKYQGKNILKKYNFNKHNPNYNYILLKSCKNLTNDGINCLQQSKELPLNDIERIFKEPDNTGKIKTFLYYVISRHFKEPVDDCEIVDSIYMAFYLKQKIPLNRLKTNSSVRKYHDKLTYDFLMKKMKSRKYALKIKKDSKFNDLRAILPPEFEWIKNKKRLIQETVIQHHCVATYNELINKDVCTIYSTIYKGKRYTMEFRKEKKKFYLHQVQGKYNVENTAEIRKYVEDILIDYYSIHSSSSPSSSNLPK